MVTGNSIKEFVVLHKPPVNGRAEFRFNLNAGGLIPRTTEAGGIEIVDPKGEVLYDIPPAVAADSNPDPSSVGPAHLELAKEGANWVVILRGDTSWLTASERKYPVYLDPAVNVRVGNHNPGGGYDSFVLSGSPTTNYNQYIHPVCSCYVNYLGNGSLTSRTYARFGVEVLGAHEIISAHWFGNFVYDAFGDVNYKLRKVPTSWAYNTITWANQPALGTQTKAGGANGNLASGWQIVDVKDWVTEWMASPGSNHGIEFDAGQDATPQFKMMGADNNPVNVPGQPTGIAPFIGINYSNSPPSPSTVVSPTVGSTVNTLTPTLSGTVATDADGDPVQYLFGVYDNAGPSGWTWLSNGGNFQTGPQANIAQVTSGLQWGHTYTWLIYTYDGIAVNNDPELKWGSFTTQQSTTDVGSDLTGLEDFYPYRPFDLGQGTAFANMANGNLVVQDEDFNIPGHGLNMRLVRTYNSSAADETVEGPLGKGWRLGILDGGTAGLDLLQTINLIFGNHGGDPTFDQKTFVLIDIDGTKHTFVRDASNNWKSPPGVNLILSDTPGMSYTFTRPDGVYFTFTAPAADQGMSSKYRLYRVGDRKGNYLEFEHTADRSKLKTITDNFHRKLTLDQPGNRLEQVTFTDPSRPTKSLVTRYSYDASGRLERVTDAYGEDENRSTTFAYEGVNALLKTVTDAREYSTTFTYETNGMLQGIEDRAGQSWTFASCAPDAGTSAICLTDPESRVETWSTNAASNLVALKDAGDQKLDGEGRRNTKHFEWFGSGVSKNRISKSIDEKGNETLYQWTPKGSLRSTSRPGGDGTTLTTDFFYYPDPIAGTLDPDPDDPTVADTAADVDPTNLGWEDMVKSATRDRVQLYYPRLKSAAPGEKTHSTARCGGLWTRKATPRTSSITTTLLCRPVPDC